MLMAGQIHFVATERQAWEQAHLIAHFLILCILLAFPTRLYLPIKFVRLFTCDVHSRQSLNLPVKVTRWTLTPTVVMLLPVVPLSFVTPRL